MPAPRNIVLAHGAWADGSSWSSVIERLQGSGYKATALQFGLGPLADDVARHRHVLSFQDGPTIVAGHSYGGQIMTASARTRRTPSVWSTSPPSGSMKASPSAGCSRRERRRPHWRISSSTTKVSPGSGRTTS